jgi:hypothetical protein
LEAEPNGVSILFLKAMCIVKSRKL